MFGFVSTLGRRFPEMLNSCFYISRISLIVGAAVVYGITLVFNYFAANPAASGGLFNHTIANLSYKYYIEIIPADWTFGIWGFIFAWQVAWLLYGLSTICKKTNCGYLYFTPPVMPPVIYLMFILNCISVIIWLLVWDREFLGLSFVSLAISPLTLCVALYFSFKRLYSYLAVMNDQGLRTDIFLIRILVQNGLAFFATWASIASLLCLSIMLTYVFHVRQDISSTISLSILFVEIIAWFVLDNVLLDKYVRYTVTPYMVLIVAFVGVVSKNFNIITAPRNSIFSVGLLVISSAFTVTKFVLMVYRYFYCPIQPEPMNFWPGKKKNLM